MGRWWRPRRVGLTQQVWSFVAVPITVALGLYGVIAHHHRRRVILADDQAELRDYSFVLEAVVEGALRRGDFDVARERMERASRADRILGVALYAADGPMVFATHDLVGATSDLGAIAHRAFQRAEPLEESTTVGGRLALVHTALLTADLPERSVCLIVARDLSHLDALFHTLDRGLAATGLVLLGLTLAVVAVASRLTVGRPARAIVRGAEQVAEGDLHAVVPEEGSDEMMRLAAAFNVMTRSLADARRRVDDEVAARGLVERRLQQMQALAAVGQVAASLGHEIGSPLNVILGRAQRAAAFPEASEKVRRELEIIAQQSERISRVVAQLLAVVRPKPGATRGCDLVAAVDDALAFLSSELRHRRIVSARAATVFEARVELDADRVFQIAFNLVMNAVEAQPEGGEVFVRVVEAGAGDGTPRFALEVEDRGKGIDEASRARVFEPFFTTKGASGGTGLGLAIVEGIVRDAGGSVRFDAASPRGTTFRVELPCEFRVIRSVSDPAPASRPHSEPTTKHEPTP